MKAFTPVIVVAILVIYINNAHSLPVGIKASFIDDILMKVPDEERITFLKFHVNLGYQLLQKAGDWPDSLTNDFAVQLYKYAMDAHQITDPETLKAARKLICFDDGTCIDLGDIGVHP